MTDREKEIIARLLSEIALCCDTTCHARPLESAVEAVRELLEATDERGG